jgi:hypothetical protein
MLVIYKLKNVDLSKVIVCVGTLTAALLIAVLGVAARTIYNIKNLKFNLNF